MIPNYLIMDVLIIEIITIALFFIGIICNVKILKNKDDEDKKETIEAAPPIEQPYDIEKLRLLLSSDDMFKRINELLDHIIDNAITMYQVQTPSLEGQYQYIKAVDVDQQLTPYVFFTTMQSMTPDVVAALHIIYEFDPFNYNEFIKNKTADYIPDPSNTHTLDWIVYTRAHLAVVDYVRSVNT